MFKSRHRLFDRHGINAGPNTGPKKMIPPLDVFRREKDGTLIWKCTAINLDAAKLSIKKLAAASPGEYEILHHQSGERIVITFDRDGQAQGNIACPKHDTFMVPHTDPLDVKRSQGKVSFRCANLDCSIVYVTGTFAGLYTLDERGKLTPYLK
jgi:hypothetical protein